MTHDEQQQPTRSTDPADIAAYLDDIEAAEANPQQPARGWESYTEEEREAASTDENHPYWLVCPNPNDPCYDCGSDIPRHHTPSCGMAEADAIRDLPEVSGTQHWTEAKRRRAR